MRKKKKLKLRTRYPENYNFWSFILQDEKALGQFVTRGDKRQKELLLHTLMYMENENPDLFKKVNGKEVLKQVKE